MDFTLKTYKNLLLSIKDAGYKIQTFEDFITNPKEKTVVLRHDVDRIPSNALKMAEIEYSLNIKASYYFRVVKKVWNEYLITKIADLGHEVSYHYEDMTICKGNKKDAIKHFKFQLENIRKFYPSKTICMHGSPFSKYDNRELWDDYNYKEFGIIAEPYFDVDYNEVFYITDTGRQWNNESISVRDKVESGFNFNIKSTNDIISLAKNNKLPDKVMINTHPHRWFNYGLNWYKELIMQNIKNQVKALIVKRNNAK